MSSPGFEASDSGYTSSSLDTGKMVGVDGATGDGGCDCGSGGRGGFVRLDALPEGGAFDANAGLLSPG